MLGLPGGFRVVKINVFGATGGLGSRVVDALLGRGLPPEDLIACSRSPDKIRRFKHLGIDIRRADYEVPETLSGALEGTDVLMLIPSASDVEPRIVQHSNILDAARSARVKRVVLASSSAARMDSKFLIAPYLVYAESRLRTSGLGWTILRNGIYLDPLVDWAPALAAMGRLPYPVSRGRVAYVSRDDLARACAAACAHDQHADQVYELTGLRALSMPDLASALTDATGQRVDAWAEENLFRPIGIDEYYWKLTPTGEVDTEGGLYLSAHDLARIGYLMLREGEWNGRQIVSREWVRVSTSPVVSDVYPGNDRQDSGYGYQWWIPVQEDGETRVFAGNGYGGQFVHVVPEHDLVSVFNGWTLHQRVEMSSRMALQDRIIPAVRER